MNIPDDVWIYYIFNFINFALYKKLIYTSKIINNYCKKMEKMFKCNCERITLNCEICDYVFCNICHDNNKCRNCEKKCDAINYIKCDCFVVKHYCCNECNNPYCDICGIPINCDDDMIKKCICKI